MESQFYLPIGLFFLGQLVATGQVSQASAASISKPNAIVSPHSHCQPSGVWFVKTLLHNGHLSILKSLYCYEKHVFMIDII
jgi:hypothetical protein